MKTKNDPRHQKRRLIVQSLFSCLFQKDPAGNPLVKEITNQSSFLDKEIIEAAPEWPLERINKIDLSILRLAIFEILIQKKEPVKVIVDEAIELAKEFGSENSPAFINGVLGHILEKFKL